MKVIFGLGNPGQTYEATRHNVGFWLADRLAGANNANFTAYSKLLSHVAKVNNNPDFLVVKPQTFMNDSGKSVLAVVNWYHIKTDDILVVHDETALPVGKMRFTKNSGAGGQHGVESIIAALGKNFTRLRIGVGPDPGGHNRAHYVLGVPPDSEKINILNVIETSMEGIKLWLNNDLPKAMNLYNGLNVKD